ncbi:MAG TPA: hypothetical protein VG318_17710 [Actinomycetota bacterium]|nr:hypothetical protein [Actinomycetota bacterium]
MRPPRRIFSAGLVALLAVPVACRPDTVALEYRFPSGVREYRLEAAGSARWDIGGGGEGSYRVIFDVSERVREDDGDTAVVEVRMSPIEVVEDGLPAPGSGDRSFALRLDRYGGVPEVLEVDGVDVAELDPDELVFIGTYRPALPLDPVKLGGAWDSERLFDVGRVFQEIQARGTLESLYLDDDGPIAELSYTGEGPLRWTTQLPQGLAELVGTGTTEQHARFEIDEGVLREATSTTLGTFEVRVVPSGGAGTPLTGTLELELELEVAAREPMPRH